MLENCYIKELRNLLLGEVLTSELLAFGRQTICVWSSKQIPKMEFQEKHEMRLNVELYKV